MDFWKKTASYFNEENDSLVYNGIQPQVMWLYPDTSIEHNWLGH